MTQSRSRLSRSATMGRFAQDAEETAARERAIQAKNDKKDKGAKRNGDKKPMQAGTREYPAPPLPAQHMESPAPRAPSIWRRCTRHRATRARRSCSTRWR